MTFPNATSADTMIACGSASVCASIARTTSPISPWWAASPIGGGNPCRKSGLLMTHPPFPAPYALSRISHSVC
jgi:hypothetical protein